MKDAPDIPVNVRYPRELRDNIERLSQVLVSTPGGAQIPISQIADIKRVTGPSMIRDENGMLAGYVFVDLSSNDIGGYVEQAKQIVRREACRFRPDIPWSGAASMKTCSGSENASKLLFRSRCF